MVTTDASKVAISAVLTQPDDDGHNHSVAYKNRKLIAAEQAYLPHALQLPAVVHALRVFRSSRTSRSGQTTRRPRGCARSGTSPAFAHASSTISRSSASTWNTSRVALTPPTSSPAAAFGTS